MAVVTGRHSGPYCRGSDVGKPFEGFRMVGCFWLRMPLPLKKGTAVEGLGTLGKKRGPSRAGKGL